MLSFVGWVILKAHSTTIEAMLEPEKSLVRSFLIVHEWPPFFQTIK